MGEWDVNISCGVIYPDPLIDTALYAVLNVMLTDADFLGGHDWCVNVLVDAVVCVLSSADWEHEVVAFVNTERPVLGVVSVPGSLKGQGQGPVAVRHRRVLHVLNGVFSRS